MFSRALALYEPINSYKPVAPDIGIVDGPLEFMPWAGIRLPFTTRMTVVRLGDGGLLLHSPTRFDPTLAAQLQTIGPIRHLVSPNRIHYAGIGNWSRAFPRACCWASPRVRERAKSQGIEVRFNRDLTADAPTDWNRDLVQTLVPGSFMDEVVFFHLRSRTLVLADLIENFELDKIRRPYRWIVRLAGAYHPHGQMPIDLRMTFRGHKDGVRRAVETMLAWQPERIILSHGRCIDRSAADALRYAFRWAL